jgi:large subunit ribosomal protein L24e
MVIKYQTCSFSDYKIAPGHGIRYCEVNGKLHYFITKKTHSLYTNSKKPLNLRWTTKWRIAHKKGKTTEAKNRNLRHKVEKKVRAIVGLSLDEINKIKEAMKDERQVDAQRFKHVQDLKEKKKKFLEKVKKNKPAVDKFAKGPKGAAIPKNQNRGKR